MYPFIVVEVPPFCRDKAKIHSRHRTLKAAKKALLKHQDKNVPVRQRMFRACIVERTTSRSTTHVLWSGIRRAKYPIHGV